MYRDIERKLENWKNRSNRKPLIINGVRQVGKTHTLLKFGESFPSYHYFNFEKDPKLQKIFSIDLDPVRIIGELQLYCNKTININDLVIFDEIQECPKAITSLKYFHEEKPQLSMCSAGSLLGVYLNPESFPVGKVELLKMSPLSFEEFLHACDETSILQAVNSSSKGYFPEFLHEKMWSYLKYYFVVGGLPEVVSTFVSKKDNLLEAFKQSRNLQNNLLESYLSDMSKHSGKTNSLHLTRILHAVPEQLCKNLDSSTSRFRFKGVVPNVKEYHRLSNAITWLEKAGLITKISIANQAKNPLYAYCKENIFKLFMFDIGILGAISNLPPSSIIDYDYGSYKGYFAENYVLQQAIATGDCDLYAWQENTSEIEFILENKGNLIPVEVKSGASTKSKSMGVFNGKYNPNFRIKISGKPLTFSHDNKSANIPLYLAGHFFKESTLNDMGGMGGMT